MNRKNAKGFSLMELMIVVAIVGILAGIAYPSYLDSVRKSRRADGAAALTTVQIAQEKFRANCRFYADNGGVDSCGANAAASTVLVPTESPDGWYSINVTNPSATGYTVTATGQGDQANDEAGGATCTLVLTVSAANPDGVRTPAACWSRN